VRRKGRVVRIVASSGAEAIVDETRALGAISVEVQPVGLKDIFLETVAED
jgi:hypothetical protein